MLEWKHSLWAQVAQLPLGQRDVLVLRFRGQLQNLDRVFPDFRYCGTTSFRAHDASEERVALNLQEGQTVAQIVRHWTLPIVLFAVGGFLIWRSGRNYLTMSHRMGHRRALLWFERY